MLVYLIRKGMVRRYSIGFIVFIHSVCLSWWAHLLVGLLVSLICGTHLQPRTISVFIYLLISLRIMFFHIGVYLPHFFPEILIEFIFIQIHFFPFLKKILGEYINFFLIYLSIINNNRIHLWYKILIFFSYFNLIYFLDTFGKIILCLCYLYYFFCLSFTYMLIFL